MQERFIGLKSNYGIQFDKNSICNKTLYFITLAGGNMNRAQRRAIKRKSPKALSVERFDKLTEAQQIEFIKRIRPDFNPDSLTNPKETK